MSEPLDVAVRRTLDAFESLARDLDRSSVGLRPGYRSTLDGQLRSLRQLDVECAGGNPSRRAWSLGQAAHPVLASLLNGAGKPAVGLDAERIDECRQALASFGRALTDHAEGR